jgi:type III secretory pathway component EscU
MDLLKQVEAWVISGIQENYLMIKIVAGMIAYSAMEYWFGKTDKVKEGSFLEFTWARIKSVFKAFKGDKDAG